MARFRLRFFLCLLSSIACVACVVAADDDGFQPIFNGKDLTGWEGDPELWSVQDGAITGKTTEAARLPYNKFLLYRGAPLKNFELRAKVRMEGTSNSGIQYRSRTNPAVGPFSVAGYQADIHTNPAHNAMLYDERGRGILAESGQKVVIDPAGKRWLVGSTGTPPATKLDEWNDYTIIAEGNHLIHKLNGHTTVDIVDLQESERELTGILALQLHVGPAMTAQFKDVRIKSLPDGGVLAADKAPIPADAKELVTPKPAPKAKAKAKGAEAKRAAGPAVSPVTAKEPEATPPSKLKTVKGFRVELLYSVPRKDQGSWVSMTMDPRGRLIVCDQYGQLFRVTPPLIGGSSQAIDVEPINVDIGEAQGLLWAFDSLYVVVNRGKKYDSGLYRVRDTNGDDKLDKVELLRKLEGVGEHGPHGVQPSPDGKSIYLVAGNATALTDVTGSLVPKDYGEDYLLPRMIDGSSFMAKEKAPGGCVYRVDPDGKNWELVSIGFRNAYDLAFNRDGELFTYDSDMEWDVNTPWYRPTRVCHVVSGADFGYRNGSGKFPTYYFDSLPPTVDVGPGSPTGITFGYGAKFPQKYQDALFICDWSYGKLYAAHMKADGATYSAELEEFITGAPLPLTDLTVNPKDGALYFAIGGRQTTSGLYRVTYVGDETITPVAGATEAGSDARLLRHRLEAFHGRRDAAAVDAAWPHLGHPDRFVRWAARVAVEFQDPATWRERALAEKSVASALPALLALVRVSAIDPAHRQSTDSEPDPKLKTNVLGALSRFHWNDLDHAQKLDYVRLLHVLFHRAGAPDQASAERLVAQFNPLLPAKSRELNVEIARLLIFLQDPAVAAKALALLDRSPTQEEQIDYLAALRFLRAGWTPEERKAYFNWFIKAAKFKGGHSLHGFLKYIRNDAQATLEEDQRDLKAILETAAKPAAADAGTALPPRAFVKEWTVDELTPIVEKGLQKRDFARGRAMFAATSCFGCHRFNNEGGAAGPDLSGVSGRFSVHDLLESIIQPSKVISDQYQAITVATSDGQVVTGRIMNLHANVMTINTNMLDPSAQTNVDRTKIEETKPSPVSLMPQGLLNTLTRDEVLDLVAYLLSRGDPANAMFH